MRSLFALAATVALSVSLSGGLAGCAVDAEGEEDLDRESEALSCATKTTTGYRSGSSFRIQVINLDGKSVEIATAMAFIKMRTAARKAGVNIGIVSGFRTMAEQQYLYNCYLTKRCNGGNLAARPGYSNHQSGHALDLNTSSGGVYSWLSNNGGRFGFKRTVPSEAWHWEYWGPMVSGPCSDKDKDGIVDSKDNCPNEANRTQTDLDRDGKGNHCDGDMDGDGVGNSKDNCPRTKNASQADLDKDGKGDACDGDDDGDGRADTKDNCPRVKNANQADLDKDGKGDACDGDIDGDGVANAKDNCPREKNPGQVDTDGDGKGDACDADDDQDGIADVNDNCKGLANGDQVDTDGDGKGDACDGDRDGDGIANAPDNCPETANADQLDGNADGIGDACAPTPEALEEDAPEPYADECADGSCGPADSAVPGETSDTVDNSALELEAQAESGEVDPESTDGSAPLTGSCTMGSGSNAAGSSMIWLVGALGMATMLRRRR